MLEDNVLLSFERKQTFLSQNVMKYINKLLSLAKGIWRRKYLWTITLFVVIIGFVDENSYWNRRKLVEENEATMAEITRYEERYKSDEARLNQLKSDPQALIRVARENHHMKSSDEDVYYVVSEDTVSRTAE